MKILIYTGYHSKTLSLSGWREHGSTGAINQTIEMAYQFAARGHDITVSGEVEPDSNSNIKFMPTQDLESGRHFDLVIAVNYIHYIKELDSREVTWDKSVFIVHHHNHYPWWRGEELPDKGSALFHDPRMSWVVTLSDAHKKIYLKANPGASKKAKVIANAISPADWADRPVKRVPNRFIFTSRNAGALKALRAIWPEIRDEAPDATLVIAEPYYGDELQDHFDMEGCNYLGSLSAEKLREEILAAEYWINPSTYVEEYGLAALEMMMGGVKIVSTTHGNLINLIPGHGCEIEDGDMEDAALAAWRACRDDVDSAEQKLAAARGFAEAQSWDSRLVEWFGLIDEAQKAPCKYPELYSYFDDPEAWEERFITYAARTKEWDLVVDEPFDNCFAFPLFTEEFCTKIRDEAEFSECWTTDRHEFYPTTDMLLQVLGLNETYRAIIAKYVMPCARKLWTLPPNWDNHKAETFLAKYTASAQGHLSLHHDASDLTCLIQLSNMKEYEGGGTYFVRQKQLVKNDMGWATLHPGNITHRHGGRAISSGLRYILVSFISLIR